MPRFPQVKTLRILTLLLLAGLLLGGCSKDDRLNVLLITIDTTRADYIGCYGSPDVQTPNLDRLAGEGVQFMRCIAPSQCTNPSHATIHTGLPAARHGVYDNETPLTGAAVTLAEVFRDADYQTLGAVSARHLSAANTAFDQGFQVFLDCEPVELTAGERNEQFLSRLRFMAGKPFFAWVHFYDPHWTYIPPPPFDTLHPVLDDHALLHARHAHQPKAPPEKMFDPDSLIALYKGEISYLDHQIGRVLSTLDELGIREKTIVALIADHGESMTEKGIYFEHGGMFNQVLHIPFILRCPDLLPAGLRVEPMVSGADVFPTLIGLAGLTSPVSGLEGRDLAPLIADPSTPLHRYVFSEAVGGIIRSVSGVEYKFIKPYPEDWTTPRRLLFRPFADYQEERDLMEQEPEVARRLETVLEKWLAAAQAKALPVVTGHEVDEETRKALRALGY